MGVDARGARSRARTDASVGAWRTTSVGARRATSSIARRRRRERGVVGVVARVTRRARAATDRTTPSRAAPPRATKVVMFYHG